MKKKLPLTDLKAGQKVLFTVTGMEFILSKVTEKNVSWFITEPYQANTNTMKMAWGFKAAI